MPVKKDPSSSAREGGNGRVGMPGGHRCTVLSRTKGHRLRLEQGNVSTQGCKPSTFVWALCLLFHLYGALWGWKAARESAFPSLPPLVLTRPLKQQMKPIKSSRTIAHLEFGGEVGSPEVPKSPIMWLCFAASVILRQHLTRVIRRTRPKRVARP